MAHNLSGLHLALGEVAKAVQDAERSVAYAYSTGEVREIVEDIADALHQAGRRTKAERRFREAEQIQAKSQPDYPLLYSLQGFRYCDLLLAAPERATWHTILSLNPQPSNISYSESCHAVFKRATQTLKWVTGKLGLFHEALDHLTLGRAALYAAVLERSAALPAAAASYDPAAADYSGTFFPTDTGAGHRSALLALQTVLSELDAAVDGLRHAGTQDHIPRSLLTRAWLRFLAGARTGSESAQEDLDEAWEIAGRGAMKLFLCDIHLHRARLFFCEEKYPWESPVADLAAAEKLINNCGYHRRDEELADAKSAILAK